MVCAPPAKVDDVNVAIPELLRVAEPNVVEPSLNMTVPVGTPIMPAGRVTVAVKVTV